MEKQQNVISPLSIIADIQNKKRSPESLSKDERQTCVETLAIKDATNCEIAEFFKVDVRTVYRDLADIKKENAIERSPEFVKEQIGQLETRANVAISNLTKIANSKGATNAEKTDANYKAWLIEKERIQTLQSLCYLPCAATEVNAQINHAFARAPDANEIAGNLISLETRISEGGVVDSTLAEMICLIKKQLTLSTVSAQITEIKTKLEEN